MEGEVIGFEEIAVNGSVVPLSSIIYSPLTGPAAAKALITVEGGDMRYRVDGQDPTVSTGHLLNDGDALEVNSIYLIQKFRVINVAAVGKISVSYES